MIYFLELFVPRARFAPDELQDLAHRLTLDALLTHVDAIPDVVDASEVGGADPGVIAMLRDHWHVVVHEIGAWMVGSEALGADEPARYVARVHVPGPWRKAMSAFLVASITRAIAHFDPDPRRLYEKPHVQVAVVGVPDGGYGVFGRVLRESDVLDLITAAKTTQGTATVDGRLIDPVCGMIAVGGLTLEHEGTTYGFCSPGCRSHFAKKLAAEDS
jgi:YHS domain-containing protein